MPGREPIRLFKVAMSDAAAQAVGDTLSSGYIGQGPKVEQFEEALENLFGLPRRPVTTNSCTSALDLALELVGVGPGDAVVTTPQTCTATNTPIVKRHAIPVWADVNQRGLVTAESVLRAWLDAKDEGLNVKAVMVVDWAGAPVEIGRMRNMLPDNLPIIEDAAHRLPFLPRPGQRHYGEADYTAWSFQAIKYLTTGDGGALLTPPNQLHRAKLLRWYGLDRESNKDFRCAQNIGEVGFKYHMNDIAATIGLANLPLAIRNLKRQKANAAYLAKALGLEFYSDSHYWFFPYFTPSRDRFMQYMESKGIETSQVHARNDKHTGFQYPRRLPGVDLFDSSQVALPCGWWLGPDELDYVAEAVLSFR